MAFHCNRFKGPNIAGLDPASGELVRFGGARLVGLTPIGRATIHVLAMNADDLLLFRTEILHEGRLVGSLAKRKRRGGEE